MVLNQGQFYPHTWHLRCSDQGCHTVLYNAQDNMPTGSIPSPHAVVLRLETLTPTLFWRLWLNLHDSTLYP